MFPRQRSEPAASESGEPTRSTEIVAGSCSLLVLLPVTAISSNEANLAFPLHREHHEFSNRLENRLEPAIVFLLESTAREFSKLIEKEHTVVSHADFAGPRDGAAANQTGIRDRVVR
jgi:hypothetical protein